MKGGQGVAVTWTVFLPLLPPSMPPPLHVGALCPMSLSLVPVLCPCHCPRPSPPPPAPSPPRPCAPPHLALVWQPEVPDQLVVVALVAQQQAAGQPGRLTP